MLRQTRGAAGSRTVPAARRVRGGRVRAARLAVRVVRLAVGGTLLAGCTGPGTPMPPSAVPTGAATVTSAPAPARSTGPRSADDVRATSVALTAGDVTLAVAVPVAGARTDTLDDGSVRLTVDVADTTAAPALVLTLAAPSGSTFDVLADGSVELLAADGTISGGLAVPATSGSGLRARFAAVADDVLDLKVTPRAGAAARAANAPAATVTLWFGTRMLAAPADWGEREGGRSLAVRPTTWARAGGLAAEAGVWAAVIAQEPEADANGMHDQLLCHALGAPDKAAWNLEPWRPDVGSLATLAARCNPN
ncbi:MAG: DUF2599 domain-containing protein [Cellulomonas sp.]